MSYLSGTIDYYENERPMMEELNFSLYSSLILKYRLSNVGSVGSLDSKPYDLRFNGLSLER